MAITRLDPNTIYLGGPKTVFGDLAASEAITPGMLMERFASGTVNRLRKSTLTDKQNRLYALDHSMANKGVDDAYAANDLVEGLVAEPGTTVWALVASGANIAFGQGLSDAGNGKLKAVGAGIVIAFALEKKDNSAGPGDARIRVEVA